MVQLRPVMLVLLLAVSALADDEVKPSTIKPAPSSSTAPPPPPTPPPTPPPSQATTVVPTVEPHPITNKPPTKPPTTKPTTKPTTTEAPTTPAPTTPTTTTVKPTSPTPAPTTTAAPPTPDPKKGTWSASFPATNVTCILVQAAIQIEIPYQDGNITKMVKVNVPDSANATGTCHDKDEKQNSLRLEWNKVVNGTSDDVTLEFAKNGSKFDLDKVAVNVNVSIPGSGFKVLNLVHVRNEFATPVSKSYKCAKEQTLNLTVAASNDTSGYLRISQVQLQAFQNATGTNFAQAMDCAGSETPDVVPIAVGCALATLVVIVLVAYLIGRRRSQARGYLSMFVENKREEDYIPMKNLSCFN